MYCITMTMTINGRDFSSKITNARVDAIHNSMRNINDLDMTRHVPTRC